MVWTAVAHTAYKVVSEETANVAFTARAVPLHVVPGVGCVVHQPLKVKPVLTRVPISRTVALPFEL